jgi:serine protease Do
MRTHSLRYFMIGLVLAAVAGLTAAPPAWAQGSTYSKDNLRDSPKMLALFREVVARPGDSTVRILGDKKPVALGTVVGEDGWILTKYSELIEDGKLKKALVCLLRDGREFAVTLISFDERFDLALLKIECTGLKPVEWCDSKAAPVGNWVAAPGTGEDPVAIGVVSVAARNVPVGKTPPPAKPGGGYLGIGLATDDTVARVSQVAPGQAAEKAGIKVNDIILSVNGEEVKDGDALIAMLQRFKPKDVVKLTVKRGDQEIEVEATLGQRPASLNRADFQNTMGGHQLSARRAGFPTILHHDAAVKPADCGGPLVDLDGRVIGINIARVGRTETNAIPSEAVRPVLEKLMPERISVPRRLD